MINYLFITAVIFAAITIVEYSKLDFVESINMTTVTQLDCKPLKKENYSEIEASFL